MEFLALIFIVFLCRGLISTVASAASNTVVQASNALNNSAQGLSNATESLPTYGLAIAGKHLIELDDDLAELNKKNGTQFKSFAEVVKAHKK